MSARSEPGDASLSNPARTEDHADVRHQPAQRSVLPAHRLRIRHCPLRGCPQPTSCAATVRPSANRRSRSVGSARPAATKTRVQGQDGFPFGHAVDVRSAHQGSPGADRGPRLRRRGGLQSRPGSRTRYLPAHWGRDAIRRTAGRSTRRGRRTPTPTSRNFLRSRPCSLSANGLTKVKFVDKRATAGGHRLHGDDEGINHRCPGWSTPGDDRAGRRRRERHGRLRAPCLSGVELCGQGHGVQVQIMKETP